MSVWIWTALGVYLGVAVIVTLLAVFTEEELEDMERDGIEAKALTLDDVVFALSWPVMWVPPLMERLRER